MSQLELLKNELWALFDRMAKDATGTGIKTGLVAAQAIVAKHTDGYELVPVESAKNTERLNFLLDGNRIVTERCDWDEVARTNTSGLVVADIYWIDGFDYHNTSFSQSKLEAIDKAMIQKAQENKNG